MQNDLRSGTICIAAKSHQGTRPNELTFQKGDVLTIVSEGPKHGEHCQATVADGSVGLFPSSCILARAPVPLQPMQWYHGSISRFDAEKLLNRNEDGQYLFRTSQNTRGVYALALSCRQKVNHYLVAMDFKTKKITINGERFFSNLPSLVTYYMSHSEGLGTCLLYPVIQRGSLGFYIDSQLLKENWGLSQSDIDLGQEIGKGEFGEVCTGTYRGYQVAIKSIHNSKQSSLALTTFLREAAVMTHLHHKNLVQLVGLIFKGSELESIVLELMGKGSLKKYLISRGRSVISSMELLGFARDVCAGMEYINSQGFVHRDIAARNVLLNSNGQAKISDFGMARKADIFVPHEGGKFPVKWTAPEALKESIFSTKSDVWSFGVFLWEVYSFGRVPYPSIPSDDVLAYLEEGGLLDPPDVCSDHVYDVMCSCWEVEPGDRPDFPALQYALQSSFGESSTPSSSHVPTASNNVFDLTEVQDMVLGPVATQAYREAPLARKAIMNVASIIFLGPLGSGKTSLIRCFTGQPFRLMEPATRCLNVPPTYSELRDHLHWLPSSVGLMYEDELVRVIIDDLLKHAQSLLTSSSSSAYAAAGPAPPPLPIRKRRSQSFTEPRLDEGEGLEETRATNRLSGSFEVIESNSPEGRLQLGYRSQPVAAGPAPSIHRRSLRKSFISRFLKGKGVRRHYSETAKRANYVGPVTNGTENGDSAPKYYSPLPERLVDKIRLELKECSGNTLAPKFFGRLIDTPGGPAFATLRSLLVTENSVCVVVYDASHNMASAPVSPAPPVRSPEGHGDRLNGHSSTSLSASSSSSSLSPTPPSPGLDQPASYLAQIMSEINDACLQWVQTNPDMALKGPRIVLVGTHSDRVPLSTAQHNHRVLMEAVRSSPYEKFVAVMRYIISSSSVIERTNIDDFKRFVMEMVKKLSKQQVPLKWLRCIRRFQGLSRTGHYFYGLDESRALISEICDLASPSDADDVLSFLHRNHVVLHFARVHQLRDMVITDPQWFVRHVSAFLSAASLDLRDGASELASDQHLLRTKGVFTRRLLEVVFADKAARSQADTLLSVMHKMDLLCVVADGPGLLVSAPSLESLSQNGSMKHGQHCPVTSIVVPALVEESLPPHLASLPAYAVENLYFRFNDGHVPGGFFSWLAGRCVHSYPTNFLLYCDGAAFEVDQSSLLLLRPGRDWIRISLHRIGEGSPNPLIMSPAPTDLDHLINATKMPSPDTCMAVLMFLQAAVSDLVQQWLPHLDFDLCIGCGCQGYAAQKRHYAVLSDAETLFERSSIVCEVGTQLDVQSSVTCWFGHVPDSSHAGNDDVDYITDADVSLVVSQLGASWAELGQILGFSRPELERFSRMAVVVNGSAGERMLREWQTLHHRSATFFALLGALEIVQRRDIADALIAVRMSGDGIAV